MRLGVDGLRLMGNRLGVGRYIEYLLRCWTDAQHPFSEIVAYTPGAVEIPGLGRGKVRVEPLGLAIAARPLGACGAAAPKVARRRLLLPELRGPRTFARAPGCGHPPRLVRGDPERVPMVAADACANGVRELVSPRRRHHHRVGVVASKHCAVLRGR